jgi:hypothetical protein
MGARHLYIIQSSHHGAFKVGRSDDPAQRLKQLQTGSPYPLKLVLVLEDMGRLETQLHRRLAHGKTRGGEEWFDYDVLPELPDWIYNQLDLDQVNWWWCGGVPKNTEPGLSPPPDRVEEPGGTG